MGLSVTVLGCSGSYPGRGGACSGYLVDDGTTRLWLDAGSGTLANLQHHLALDQLDAIVVSHEHPDHWNDLEGWNIVLRYVLDRSDFPVYAPSGLKEQTYDGMPKVAWTDVADGDRLTIGTLEATFSQTDHGRETLAVRVDAGGRSLGYSADTGPGWSLEALGGGLHLALCEATVPSEQEGEMQHLSARQAGEQARAAGAGRLVLTHLWPMLDPDRAREEGTDAFGGPVEVAVVGARYDV
ncbi:MAG TPA: MBL fold metallo-hydrolase [Acidimicrobiales bacterium]|nr:MBL fold metallo-hydrolase [Acidimicrobiales bacterium]